jgi:chromosome segregation ATPase
MGEMNQLEKTTAAVAALKEYVVDMEKQTSDVFAKIIGALRSVEKHYPDGSWDTEQWLLDTIEDCIEKLSALSNQASLTCEMLRFCRDNIEKCLDRVRVLRDHSEGAARFVRMVLHETREAYKYGDDMYTIATKIEVAASGAREKLAEIRGRIASTN